QVAMRLGIGLLDLPRIIRRFQRRLILASTGRTRSRRRSPAAVGAIDRVVRSSRRTPSRSSRLRTISLTRDGELGPAAGAEGPGRTVSIWQSRRRFLKAISDHVHGKAFT